VIRYASHSHQQQQSCISDHINAGRLANSKTIACSVRCMKPDSAVQADGGDDECEGNQETEVYGCCGRPTGRVTATSSVVQGESMCDGGWR
jgi:hypothetical protein